MRPDVDAWLPRRTSPAADWPLQLLLRAKGSTARSAWCCPRSTRRRRSAPIVAAIRRSDLMHPRPPLVDELVVLDSGSTRRAPAGGRRGGRRHASCTATRCSRGCRPCPARARCCGARSPRRPATCSCFVDADLRSFTPAFVTGLLGPLLTDPGVALVKAMYDRPLAAAATVVARAGGGRVTELVARPLLNLHWPQLAGFVQPLAGEYAARRSLLERLPFPSGYGVELALLVDTLDILGLDAIAQVDLGVRQHRHQDEPRSAGWQPRSCIPRWVASAATPGAWPSRTRRTSARRSRSSAGWTDASYRAATTWPPSNGRRC